MYSVKSDGDYVVGENGAKIISIGRNYLMYLLLILIIIIYRRTIAPEPLLYHHIAVSLKTESSRLTFFKIIEKQLESFISKERLQTHTIFGTPVFLLHKYIPKLFKEPLVPIDTHVDIPVTQDVLYDDHIKQYLTIHDEVHENHSLLNMVRTQWITKTNQLTTQQEKYKPGLFYTPPSEYMPVIIDSLFRDINKEMAYNLHMLFQSRYAAYLLERQILNKPKIQELLKNSDDIEKTRRKIHKYIYYLFV